MPILEQVKQHPGRYAVIGVWANYGGAVSARMTLTKNPARRPEGEWKFTARRMEDGSGKLYAKFLGDEQPEDDLET